MIQRPREEKWDLSFRPGNIRIWKRERKIENERGKNEENVENSCPVTETDSDSAE